MKQCRLPHQRLMLVLPGAGNLVQKGEQREEGESRREKKKGRVDGGFFFLILFFYVTALTAPLHCTELK